MDSIRVTFTKKDGKRSISQNGFEYIRRSVATIWFMPQYAKTSTHDELTCVDLDNSTCNINWSPQTRITNPEAAIKMIELLNSGYEITEQVQFDFI